MSINENLSSLSNYMQKSIISNRILIAVLFVIFLIVGVVYYHKYIKPKFIKTYVDNREFIEKNKLEQGDNVTILYYFYTDWCPLCKKAEPEWNAFKEDTNGTFDGIAVKFIEVDCDKETDIADKFNITGYPTIKLEYKNKIYEYDAKPDRKILNKFLTEVFNNP